MRCVCNFCGKSPKHLSAIYQWCHITIYSSTDNPIGSVSLLQKSQAMRFLFVRLCEMFGSWKLTSPRIVMRVISILQYANVSCEFEVLDMFVARVMGKYIFS